MQYPLSLRFKILALGQQIFVTDAAEMPIAYVKQKAFKLKESVQVFADTAQSDLRYTINADRILDFNARYRFADAAGNIFGQVQKKGMRSLWKAHYDVFDADENPLFTINETNPWVKVADAVLSEIPLLGMFTGYLFHPAYDLTRPDGTPVLRLIKKPAFFEGRFTLERVGEIQPDEETPAVLSLLMLVLLERARG